MKNITPNNELNNIATALKVNATKKSKYAITDTQVDLREYAQWAQAITNAWSAFYNYQSAVIKSLNDNTTVDREATNNAYNSLKAILALVGDVNGHPLTSNNDMLAMLSKCVIKTKRERIGEALLVESELKNLKDEQKNVHTGMDEDYIKNLEDSIEAKSESLKMLDKAAGSAKVIYTRASFSVFRKAVETQLAMIICKQEATPWEVLEAEAEARKAERKARAKARRAKARQAEAQAKAEAQA